MAEPDRINWIGQVPNATALAHWLATSPLLKNEGLLCVVDTNQTVAILTKLVSTFNPDRPMQAFTGDRFTLPQLTRGSGWWVVDQGTLERLTLPAPSQFQRSQLDIDVGDTIELHALKQFLTKAGYESNHTANRPGAWSSRGDIIDVHTSVPIRIELFGNQVERIQQFDITSGSRQATLQHITLPHLSGSGRSSLFDYLPSTLPVVVFHHDPLPITQPQWIVEPFIADSHLHNAGYNEPLSYHRKLDQAKHDLAGYRGQFVISSHPADVAALNATTVTLDTLDRGFVHDQSRTICLTDASLGTLEQLRTRQTRKLRQAVLGKLAVGDYVVHLYHGVARFAGMERQTINQVEREYFVLEYAGSDKIYVPVELADRVDKYIGDAAPTLHTLGSASWHEAVSRVQENTLELAKELLDLHAKRAVSQAPQFTAHPEERALDDACSYDLTADQHEALSDIYADLKKPEPMDRLLCGDVGFGKTEVALRAAFRVVLGGHQALLLAPTTVLAQQHFDTFAERLKQFGVSVGVLSRLHTGKTEAATLAGLANGTIDIVVGTHRLLSKDVVVKRLGLAIIDEEQRFGVRAKEQLKRLRANTHALTMTATPIPRTLNLSLSGLRDISTILTPPEQRRSVRMLIRPMDTERVQQAIQEEMARGGQTYYIYNRVETIEQRRASLQELLPKARIAVGHGQMNATELSGVMHDFDAGNVDVLLATTIVENGLDIPNANTLIVEDASQFGLAELYQLKGRVGRSDRQGYAYFFYREQIPSGDVKKRFIALQDTDHLGAGFELAMRDMEIRGVGNILGKKQHGHAVKIGLGLYSRLLNQAIQQLQGKNQQPQRDIPVDLPIAAHIPDHCLPDPGDRIELYQRLAAITDRDELLQERVKLGERAAFTTGGSLHPAISGLCDVLELKILASHTDLLSIDADYPNSVNRLEHPRIVLTSQTMIDLPVPWEYVQSRQATAVKVRAGIDELGADWLPQLKNLLQQFGQKENQD